MSRAALPLAGASAEPLRTVDPIPLAVYHFGVAILYLVAGAVGVVVVAPELAAGLYTAPRVAGVTHLFTLGWLTTTIFGVLQQILPMALGAQARFPVSNRLALAALAPGAGLFAIGVAISVPALHHVGIALVTVGVLLALANVGLALPRARARDTTWAAIALAAAFLFSTLVLGVVLLHNLHTGFLALARLRILAVHLHLALVGWALVMIVGVSHRMLPGFLQARGVSTRWTAWSLACLASGVVALAGGLLGRIPVVTWTGVILLESGLACFIIYALGCYRARAKPVLDVGLRFAGVALTLLATGACLGPALLLSGSAAPRLAITYVLSLLMGIVLYVVGFFYRIAPQLVWTARYRRANGRVALPPLKSLLSPRLATLQLASMSLGATLLLIGIAIGAVAVTRGGAVLLLIGVLAFLSQIIHVAFGGRS